MNEKQPDFVPNGVFHVYNHANGWENVYKNEENYRYFLQKMGDFLPEVLDVLAYCLLPNHFHLLIQVKSKEHLHYFYQKKYKISNTELALKIGDSSFDYHKVVRQQITNFLGGYVQAFNRYHKRKGSLFMQNTNRKIVGDKFYFMNLIHYLHYNAVHHSIVGDFLDWPHSSYHSMISERPTKLARTKIIDWFGGRDAFLIFHGKEPRKDLGFEKDLECDF